MKKQEFDLRKKLLDIEHEYRMKEIKFERDCKMEVQRVKSAEIKRTIDRKSDKIFAGSYIK